MLTVFMLVFVNIYYIAEYTHHADAQMGSSTAIKGALVSTTFLSVLIWINKPFFIVDRQSLLLSSSDSPLDTWCSNQAWKCYTRYACFLVYRIDDELGSCHGLQPVWSLLLWNWWGISICKFLFFNLTLPMFRAGEFVPHLRKPWLAFW